MTVFPSAPPLPVISARAARRRTVWALILNILCITCAEVFLKTGAHAANDRSLFAFSALYSSATVAGILFYIAAFVLWIYALRTVPLSLAYNFTAINQVLIPIAAWLFLKGEHISPLRWLGIALVFIGFILLAPILARVESDPPPRPRRPVRRRFGGRPIAMNADLLIFGFICECAMVIGQLLLKRAMHPSPGRSSFGVRAAMFTLSIAAQALYFFLWIGLLTRHPLSSVYPLDAVAAVGIVFSAVIFLGERLTARAWAAITLILAGLLIISFTA